ncbi:MAG: cellulase family glycosylhydrolase, partial [Thermoguttaceae bacterium]|nr:cellulase family glycosylhydrolase [Thermoguttaceae bacterium]
MKTNRRTFLKTSVLLGTSLTFPSAAITTQAASLANAMPEASWKKLPRWRGFNLLEKFNARNVPFVEDDFRMIHDLGFNFVRLPMDYRGWIVDGDRRKFDEKTLKEIDLAVEYGLKYGIHTMINFHRAPGYTVARPQENPLVWDDQETLDVCALHWQTFAKRYAGIPGKN